MKGLLLLLLLLLLLVLHVLLLLMVVQYGFLVSVQQVLLLLLLAQHFDVPIRHPDLRRGWRRCGCRPLTAWRHNLPSICGRGAGSATVSVPVEMQIL